LISARHFPLFGTYLQSPTPARFSLLRFNIGSTLTGLGWGLSTLYISGFPDGCALNAHPDITLVAVLPNVPKMLSLSPLIATGLILYFPLSQGYLIQTIW